MPWDGNIEHPHTFAIYICNFELNFFCMECILVLLTAHDWGKLRCPATALISPEVLVVWRKSLWSLHHYKHHNNVTQSYCCSCLYMSPVKRICVFEHSVLTNFNCACPAIQRGQGSGFLSEGSSWLPACLSEQRRFWRDCADAQARLNLRSSHRR